MKKFITVTALTLLCGSAFAQNTGPVPQTSAMGWRTTASFIAAIIEQKDGLKKLRDRV